MREENERNAVAAQARRYREINWNVQIEKIAIYFQTVADKAKAEHFFETLFVERDDEHRTVQLHVGKHKIGNIETIRDDFGRATGRRVDVEHGAALVVSQSALGDVAVILYPYQSEKVRRIEPHIIWAVFKEPADVTEAVLRAAVADFLRYVRVSSSLFNESTIDRLRIRYLEVRARKYSGKSGLTHVVFSHWFWIALGAAGSFASIYSLWR